MGLSKQLRFFDVFSGIGGFKIGLERAGFKSIGFCDNDKWASTLYKAYFQTNGEIFYDDIRTINTSELPDFDIICGGFPCQAFSIAGKRQGFEDARGSLFFDLIRILKDKRPRYFVFENVKGLLNHDNRQTFITVVKALSDLGYSVQWQVLNSKFFSVPQNRERVYIVGCLGGECVGKIFPITSESDENPRSILRLGGRGCKRSDTRLMPPNKQVHPRSTGKSQGDRVYSTEGISSCLTSNGGGLGGKTGLYFIENGCGSTVLLNASPNEPSHTAIAINKPRYDKYKPSDIVETLKVAGDTPLVRVKNGTKKGYDEATVGDSINLAFAGSKTRRGRVGKKVSQTLDTSCNMGVLCEDSRIRKLTPPECFRLQAFPDEMVEAARELGIKDGQLYKMAGNAVTVNVVEVVAKKLWEAINETAA